MPRVEIEEGESPTDQVVKPALRVTETKDALGRVLKVRRLNALNKVDWAEILGAERVSNDFVATNALFAYSVTEIDGDKVMPPQSWAEVRLLIQRLDDEGIAAAGTAYVEAFGAPGQAVDTAKEAADLKNS